MSVPTVDRATIAVATVVSSRHMSTGRERVVFDATIALIFKIDAWRRPTYSRLLRRRSQCHFRKWLARLGVDRTYRAGRHRYRMQSLYRTHKSCGGSGDGSIRCVGVKCLAIHAEAVDLNVEGLLNVGNAALGIHVEVILMGRGDRQSMGSQEAFVYR